MKIRSGLATVALLGSGLLGLGVSTPAVADDVCVGTGTATFSTSAVWYPALVPGGLGADPAPGANSGTFSVSGACVDSSAPDTNVGVDIGASLSGSFTFPNGAQCGRSAGGAGTLNNTGGTFNIDTLATVVVISPTGTTNTAVGVADATPLTGTSCNASTGGTKNFTLVGAIVVLTQNNKCSAEVEVDCWYDHDNNPNTPDEHCDLWVDDDCIIDGVLP